MLTAAVLAKLIAEIALFAFAAQALVGLLAGAGKAHNPVYRLFDLLVRPWLAGARFVLPRFVPDRYIRWIVFSGLLVLWCVAVVAKVGICLKIGVALCK